MPQIAIRPARPEDCAAIRELIFALARYEKLEDQCHASVELLEKELFGENPVILCVLAW